MVDHQWLPRPPPFHLYLLQSMYNRFNQLLQYSTLSLLVLLCRILYHTCPRLSFITTARPHLHPFLHPPYWWHSSLLYSLWYTVNDEPGLQRSDPSICLCQYALSCPQRFLTCYQFASLQSLYSRPTPPPTPPNTSDQPASPVARLSADSRSTGNEITPAQTSTPTQAPSPDAMYIRSSMDEVRDDLKSIIRTNHEDSRQLVTVVHEEFSTALSTMTTAIEALQESVCPPEVKRRRQSSDRQSALIHTHDWIKAEVALQMVDVDKGTDIFPDVLQVHSTAR